MWLHILWHIKSIFGDDKRYKHCDYNSGQIYDYIILPDNTGLGLWCLTPLSTIVFMFVLALKCSV
jgi:hypothetical protein